MIDTMADSPGNNLNDAWRLIGTIRIQRMTMNPSQSYCSPESSGIRTNAVRLCVALLGFWVVTSVLILQSPVKPFSVPAAGLSSITNAGLELLVASHEEQDRESSDCCLEIDCSDSQACSSPCSSSCPAPQVAVLERPIFRDLSSGTDLTFDVENDGFVPRLATALFRPPIV